jgi:hypothetical protein
MNLYPAARKLWIKGRVLLEQRSDDLRPDFKETSQVSWMTPAQILSLQDHPILTFYYQSVIANLDSGTFVI